MCFLKSFSTHWGKLFTILHWKRMFLRRKYFPPSFSFSFDHISKFNHPLVRDTEEDRVAGAFNKASSSVSCSAGLQNMQSSFVSYYSCCWKILYWGYWDCGERLATMKGSCNRWYLGLVEVCVCVCVLMSHLSQIIDVDKLDWNLCDSDRHAACSPLMDAHVRLSDLPPTSFKDTHAHKPWVLFSGAQKEQPLCTPSPEELLQKGGRRTQSGGGWRWGSMVQVRKYWEDNISQYCQ